MRKWSLGYEGRINKPELGGAGGVTYAYSVMGDVMTVGGTRYLVQMRSRSRRSHHGHMSVPPLALDADFEGTNLSADRLDLIWGIDPSDTIDEAPWSAEFTAKDTDHLPSGDVDPGGTFHLLFELTFAPIN